MRFLREWHFFILHSVLYWIKRKGETHLKKTDGSTLLKLFLSNLYISAFTFGGGYVIVTLMKHKYVDELHWIDEEEMLDVTALAQSAPGAIAVNAAILVGWRVAGLAGMLISVLGTIIPPMAILTVVSIFYRQFSQNRYVALLLRGMRAGVAAVILDVVCGLGSKVLKTRRPVLVGMMVAAFVASFVLKANGVVIILSAIGIGICMELWSRRKGAGA